jgi:hypothetical protein
VTMPTAAEPILDAALAAHDAGLCVVRARTDGTKRPVGEWKQYQAQRPTRDEVEQWFAGGHTGMGVICGAVSGDLEMFELEGRFCEDGGTKTFTARMHSAGLELLLKRLVNGFHTISPSGGRHFIYHVDGSVDGNTKLARRPATAAELAENPDDVVKTLIETRGEGGFVVLAPSHGTVHPTGNPWRQRAGTFAAIPTITAEERAALFDVARSFNVDVARPAPVTVAPTNRTVATPWRGGTVGESWIDAVAEHLRATSPVRDLLERHGWEFCYTDGHGRQLMRRPGKDDGVSASINANGRLYVFSTSTPFVGDERTTYDELDILATYEYGGDRKAAARSVAEHAGILAAWQQAQTPAVIVPPRNIDPATGELLAPAAIDDEFWNARPWLAHIRDAARNRLVAPAALLGAVLARVAAFTPPSTCLPALVGSTMPLSLYVALRGGSGAGKSSAMAAASDLLPTVPPGCVGPLALGSGEGLVEAYMELVEEEGSDGKKRRVKRQMAHGGLFSLDEGQALNEIGSRKGSTILPILRTAWTGGDPGQANASVETRRSLRPGSYAVGLVSAWQDHVAAALLSDVGGGTPQRFIWLPTSDPDATLDGPHWPGPLEWTPPALITMANPLAIHDDIRRAVREARLDRVRTGADAGLDSHRDLGLLKIAGCLAVLDGRDDVNPDDWTLAGQIMATSDGVRNWIVGEAKRTAAEGEMASHRRAAEREAVVEQAVFERALATCARAIARKVHRDGACTKRDIHHAAPSRYRTVVGTEAAVAEAERLQWIKVDDGVYIPGKARPT